MGGAMGTAAGPGNAASVSMTPLMATIHASRSSRVLAMNASECLSAVVIWNTSSDDDLMCFVCVTLAPSSSKTPLGLPW
jgi:hypothetical protein